MITGGEESSSETLMVEVALLVLNAVVPVETFEPAVPDVWSQARNVTDALVGLLGTKRRRSCARSNSAALGDTAPTGLHVLPASVENSHDPPTVVRLVTAIP